MPAMRDLLMTDAELTRQIVAELRQITAAIQQITGLSTRWNGTVQLVPQADFKGLKPFTCAIWLDLLTATLSVRWRTLIHEALHAISAGYNVHDFMANRGWEEGVVEQLQRVLRPEVLQQIGVVVDETIFADVEAEHLFNGYIAALEAIRAEFAEAEQSFYLELLQTPINKRYASLLAKAMARPDAGQRRAAINVITASNVILTRRVQ